MRASDIDAILQDIYNGILFHNQQFRCESDGTIEYETGLPELEALKTAYELDSIAGSGSDLERGLRLLHCFAPRLTHSSWYGNHVPCNALDLLEYSLDNPKQGINCLSKAKILQECLLAVGIFARRVRLMPYSPYDVDNHVVTELFDRQSARWVMLDPTSNGYYVDENRRPLSLLEMRDRFANGGFVTHISGKVNVNTDDLEKVRKWESYANRYIAKNLFYFSIEQLSTFGPCDDHLYFVPVGFSVKNSRVANLRFRISQPGPKPEGYRDRCAAMLEQVLAMDEPAATDIKAMSRPPEE